MASKYRRGFRFTDAEGVEWEIIDSERSCHRNMTHFTLRSSLGETRDMRTSRITEYIRFAKKQAAVSAAE